MQFFIALVSLLIVQAAGSQEYGIQRQTTIVSGKVVSVSGSETITKKATIEITGIYGANATGIRVGDRLWTWTQATIHQGSDFPVVVPLLTEGAVGVWSATKHSNGECWAVSTGVFGRLWPVIEGRDSEYAAVKAWAEELERMPERQIDYEGKQWPAPRPPPPAPPALPPPLKVSLPTPAVSPSRLPESDPKSASWHWYFLGGLGILLVAVLVFQFGKRVRVP